MVADYSDHILIVYLMEYLEFNKITSDLRGCASSDRFDAAHKY